MLDIIIQTSSFLPFNIILKSICFSYKDSIENSHPNQVHSSVCLANLFKSIISLEVVKYTLDVT